jgi:uncharacterized Zn finger protein (UPF0148 family)
LSFYCSRHNINHPAYECPRCEVEARHYEAQRLANARHQEAIDAARESDYRRANPGDYRCPHCKYVTLKKGASRCPMCHGEPPPSYWPEVEAREEVERARAVAAAAERARLQKIADAEWRAADAQRRAEQSASDARKRRLQAWAIGIATAIALCIGVSVATVHHKRNRPLAPTITAVTPASFTIDYMFCFAADEEVHIEPASMINDYKYDSRGNDASNGWARRGYSTSASYLFGRKFTVTSSDLNRPVRFRIWEQDRVETRPYWACCDNRSGCRD